MNLHGGGGGHNNDHNTTSSASSFSMLDRARICPGKVVKLYDWYSSCPTKSRDVPTILSMCIHTDRIEVLKVISSSAVAGNTSTGTNTNNIPYWSEYEKERIPWWRQHPSVRTSSSRHIPEVPCWSVKDTTTTTTTTHSIPLAYHTCDNTKQRLIQNRCNVMEQLHYHLTNSTSSPDTIRKNNVATSTTTSVNTTTPTHHNNTTNHTNNHNNGILIVNWPQSRNGRRGYDCGRVLHIMEQLFSTTCSSSTSSNWSNNHSTGSSPTLPYICFYDPTRTVCDEDEWGRSSSHAYVPPVPVPVSSLSTTINDDDTTKTTTSLWIDPPYRLREQSVLLNIRSNNNKKHQQYDPKSLWQSFCTHHWPDLLMSSTATTTTNEANHIDNDHNDDSIVAIPNISKPIFASQTTSSTTTTTGTTTNPFTGVTQPRNPIHTGIRALEETASLNPCRDDDDIHTKSARSCIPLIEPYDNTMTANTTTSPTPTTQTPSWHHHHHHQLSNRNRRFTSSPLAAKRLVNFEMLQSYTTYTRTPTTTTTKSGTAHCTTLHP